MIIIISAIYIHFIYHWVIGLIFCNFITSFNITRFHNDSIVTTRPLNIAIDCSKGQSTRLSLKYRLLQSFLISEGYLVTVIVEAPLRSKYLELFDVLIILTPYGVKYQSHEVKAIVNYIRGGGGVFIFSQNGGDEKLGTNIGSITHHFDIEMVNSRVLDPINNFYENPSILKGTATGHLPNSDEIHSAIFNEPTELICPPQQVLFRSADTTIDGSKILIAKSSDSVKGKLIVFSTPSLFEDGNLGLQREIHQKLLKQYFAWICSTWNPLEESIQNNTPVETEHNPTETTANEFSDNKSKAIDSMFQEATDRLIADFIENVDLEQFQPLDDELDSFNVENTVIRMLRSFLAQALQEVRDAEYGENKVYHNVTVEGMDQLIMILHKIHTSLDKIAEKN